MFIKSVVDRTYKGKERELYSVADIYIKLQKFVIVDSILTNVNMRNKKGRNESKKYSNK